MTVLGSAVSTFMEGLLYRGREGHLSFIAHRLAGLGTLLFLAIHILDTSTVYFGALLNAPDLYNHAIQIYQSTPFLLGEILLVAAVLFHGVNGLKIILYDAFPHWWKIDFERQAFWKVLALTFLLWLPAAFFMGRSLYLHNFCRCAVETELTAAEIDRLSNVAITVIPLAFFLVLGVLSVGGRAGGPVGRPALGVAVPKTLENYIWQFMRWSGVLLIPLVWIHVAIQDVLVGVHAINMDFVALRWATWGWRLYDFALLAIAYGHGMLGLRYAVNDYVHDRRWKRVARWLMVVSFIVLMIIGTVAIVGGVQL